MAADYDVSGAEATGAYERVIGYSGGFADALDEALGELRVHTLALSYSPEDALLDGLPYGLLRTAGAGLKCCLYCRHHESTYCHLHEGSIPKQRISSLKCWNWEQGSGSV